ncbi:hypothetical protein MKMG_01335 [Methanogenium sp. MK-MG]|nr:hypothetical protein MKMG_01335 [Methanogenium sp. MK-MG]
MEGLLSFLFSEVWDQITGVLDDLRFSLIDSVFGAIAVDNSYLQEIFETFHGLITIVQALGGLVGSLVYLGFAITLLRMFRTVFSIR